MKQLILIVFLISIVSCNRKQSNDKIVAFSNDSIISFNNGNPKDSLSFYFPRKLFYDTIRYFVYNGDTFDFKSNQNIDTIIKNRNLIKNNVHLLDSVRVKDVSFIANFWSFSLFKMNEPMLDNFYLNKEYYRLIIGRSLSKFFIISIINDKDNIYMITKGLNRQVGYPLMKYAEFSTNRIFRPSGANKLTDKEIATIQQRHDSLAKEYNNTNYFVDSLIITRISKQQWTEFKNKLNKINFWDSYPGICGDCLQIDGSRWIIEGQSEIGYQIHEVLSPFSEYSNKKDYGDLFKFILTTSGLDKGKFRYY
jgi:hypothetical protein